MSNTIEKRMKEDREYRERLTSRCKISIQDMMKVRKEEVQAFERLTSVWNIDSNTPSPEKELKIWLEKTKAWDVARKDRPSSVQRVIEQVYEEEFDGFLESCSATPAELV